MIPTHFNIKNWQFIFWGRFPKFRTGVFSNFAVRKDMSARHYIFRYWYFGLFEIRYFIENYESKPFEVNAPQSQEAPISREEIRNTQRELLVNICEKIGKTDRKVVCRIIEDHFKKLLGLKKVKR